MDVNFRTIASVIVAIMGVAFSVDAQNAYKFQPNTKRADSASRALLDSLVYPTVLPEGTGALKFDSICHNLGTMKDTSPMQTARFCFVNTTDTVQTITKVRTTCGCALVKSQKTSIMPGEKSAIVITFNPHNQSGTINVSAFVYTTHSKRNPMAQLTIKGEVTESSDQWKHLPIKMGAMRLKHSNVVIKPHLGAKVIKERIAIANTGNIPLKVSAPFLPAGISVYTEPESISPQEEADLVINIELDKISKSIKDYKILLEGLSGRPSERIINLKIEREK